VKVKPTGTGFELAAATLGAALALHVVWVPRWVLALLVALVVLRVLHRRFIGTRVPLLVRLALIAGMVMIAWSQFAALGNRPVFAALLASMLVLKLVETESIRDARLVVTFSCFLAMTAFLFGQGPVQTAATVALVVLAFAALAELVPGESAGPRLGLRPVLLYALRTVALALPFSLIAFVAFPRLDAPLWRGADEMRRGRTGMSDRLEPGQFSSVALDDTPVFRARFVGEPPAPRDRYFRGMVFGAFDGSAWTGEGALRAIAPQLVVRGPVLEYEILIEATDQPWAFLIDSPVEAPLGASLGGDATVRFARPLVGATRYFGRSTLDYVLDARLPVQLRRWTLRTGPGNPRTKALAQGWRERHGDNHRAIVDEALAIITRDFTYSLDPPLLGRDPVDDFLFSSRIGFCEHFASAFALLMRAAGVPARVVVGYQGGYYNRAGGHLTVLKSDAHAWTEVWFEGPGWVRIDPTAAVSPSRIERGARELRGGFDEEAFGSVLRERWDLVGTWWTRAVVQFNALSQRELFAKIGMPESTWRSLALVFVVGGIAALGIAALLGFRPVRRRRDPVLEAWRRACRRLARAGVPRRPNEGPYDYAERAARVLPHEAPRIHALSRRFARLRYADVTLDADREAFEREVRRFRPTRAATIAGRRAS